MVTVYHAGGEDSEWASRGGATVTTTTTLFRSDLARCGFSCATDATIINRTAFSASQFWDTARLYTASIGTGANTITGVLWRASNATANVKLRLRGNAFGSSLISLVVEKVTNSGTATSLGTLTFVTPGTSAGPGSKFDIFCHYAVSGSFKIYLNNVLTFTYTGDLTTDGDTALAYHEWGGCSVAAMTWSEGMMLDVDTRTLSLQTFAPVIPGNTHNWDTGTPAASNVNEINVNYLTIDGSTTNGQIDQYTQPAVATGSYGVLAFGVSALLQRAASGPQHADLGLRTGGVDYWSTDFTLVDSFQNYQNWWITNPGTSAPWQSTEIGAASGFNIGIKSVT